jgi:hypothetical protein
MAHRFRRWWRTPRLGVWRYEAGGEMSDNLART